VRCPRCGNDNPGANRFCGMCGATLLPAPVAVAQSQVAAARVPAPPPALDSAHSEIPAPARPAPPFSNDSPGISGPSFLGLNNPPPSKRANLSIDPHSHSSSGNLDYLLDDEDEPRRGGGGKVILFLLALALAGGFGYLRWKNHGFDWPRTSNQPSATTQNPDAADTTSTSPPVTPAPIPATTQPAPQPAATTTPVAPAKEKDQDKNQDSNSAAAKPAEDSAASSAPAASSSAATSSAATSSAATSSNDSADPAANPPADSATESPVAQEPAPAASDRASASPAKPRRTAPSPLPKPPAAIRPTSSFDSVADAQRYIYGRGVAQDCERGLRLLKPAANQGNPKAMIEMGALYSAGLCTPRDLPTSYRWFALALRKDPENQAVQKDLSKLWSEMTQPERQLAIKLSQ
jgi:hypothetical protein